MRRSTVNEQQATSNGSSFAVQLIPHLPGSINREVLLMDLLISGFSFSSLIDRVDDGRFFAA
jgi:hypothetical protein